jgi:cell division protein FtsZ
MIFEPNLRIDNSPKYSKIIKVIGVGGAGCNAVNKMHEVGIKDVDLVVCNLDYDSLNNSKVPNKLQLGKNQTKGLGAGFDPVIAEKAANDSEEAILDLLKDPTQMVFLTAGMGGGTGTGATPIIAAHAKSKNILTIGVITSPFAGEGDDKIELANKTIAELKDICDAVLVIDNQNIFELYQHDDTLADADAYQKANDVLVEAVKCIAELITITGEQNIDFNDVRTTLTNKGQAMMGLGIAEGENRGTEALEKALSSPLLENCDIKGAQNLLINYTYSTEKEEYKLKVTERIKITNEIKKRIGKNARLVKEGTVYDNSMGAKLEIKIVAAGFEEKLKPVHPEPEVPKAPFVYEHFEFEDYKDALLEKYEESIKKGNRSYAEIHDDFKKVPAFERMQIELISQQVVAEKTGREIILA